MNLLLTNARVVTPGGVLDPGWVDVRGTTIGAVGEGPLPETGEQRSVNGGWIVPGLIDLHVHGGGGASLLSPDPAELRAAAEFHASRGTARLLASIVSAPLEEMLNGLAAVRDLVRAGDSGGSTVAGSHLEGPFLSRNRAGAHDPDHLLAPQEAVLDRMLETADGTLRVITLAPELPGALDLVRRAVAAGVVVALGHSDADRDTVASAFDAGASLVTHLFNAMRPLDHRDPGLATTALVRPGVVCELINDGVHLHDDTARLAFQAAGADRIALVTDAIPAAGLGDGAHRLGPATVDVTDGVARIAGTDTLAGSTLTMDRALRRAVRDLGLPVAQAVRAAATTPARVLAEQDARGSIAPGLAADLLVLDDELEVAAVMLGGEWISSGRLFDR